MAGSTTVCDVSSRDRRETVDRAMATARVGDGSDETLVAAQDFLRHMSDATEAPFSERWRWAASLQLVLQNGSWAFRATPVAADLRDVIRSFRELT